MAVRSKARSPRWFRAFAVIAGGAVFVLAACSAVGEAADRIGEPADVAVGECVKVRSSDGDDSTVEPRRSSCDVEGMTFVATYIGLGECGRYENYLTFPGTSERLCLMPNFVQGRCYQIPASSGGSLVDFKQVGCNGPSAGGATIYRAEVGAEDSPGCAADQVAVTYDRPEPRAFCLAALDHS
ncbi:pyridine nucleotide-disulfide oxidoreductase [Gordonia aurantiaca]|uniref:pyridine nucleotide-disulfide oxidoreductase n=1 Tax=Gordonia sp. B21 TaxID=3151852 RepID=UPI003265343E